MSLDGKWELVEYAIELDYGTIVKPWGDDFIGYTLVSSGFMNSSMIRTNVGENDAKESFFSYSGPFTMVNSRIRVRVAVCSEPSWVGGVQERELVVGDDCFNAITPRMEWKGTTGINKLVWE